ncbi:MAG: hypothetical protein EPN82_13860 [Bacteroidetes bacterium]|nr:MAG: hypothetical protein EPN82_13860 [Bacteroidota bacterium]
MKTIHSLIVILLIVFFYNSLLSQSHWEEIVQPPCWAGYPSFPLDWQGPFEFKFCIADTLDAFPDCSTQAANCCYTVVYYDADWEGFPGNAGSYFIYIAGIFWEGNNCDACNKEKVVEVFYRKKIQLMLNEGWFYHPNDTSWYGGFPEHLLTPGECKKNNGEVCFDICCNSFARIWADRDTRLITSFSISSPSLYSPDIQCPSIDSLGDTICQTYCYEFPFQEWIESCCDSIEVTPHIVDSTCCVNISVFNPYCYAPTPRVVFKQFNSETGNYEPKDSLICPIGDTVSYILCPQNGNKFVKYKVFIDDSAHPGTPNCEPSYYVEGKTMYTDSVDLSSCCKCDSALLDEWLIVNVVKDSTCPDSNGCRVTFDLSNMPDSITCYNYFVVEDNHGVRDVPPKDLETLPTYNFCLNKEEFGSIKFYLLQNEGENLDSACYIAAGVACDTTECCPSNHDDWLTVRVVHNDSCNGCLVNLDWADRDSIPCYNYYMVEDINHVYHNTWWNGNIDSFPISAHSFCIGTGVSDTMWVHLYKHYEDYDSTCTIMNIVSCDSIAYQCPCDSTPPTYSVDIIPIDDSSNCCYDFYISRTAGSCNYDSVYIYEGTTPMVLIMVHILYFVPEILKAQ